MTFPTLSLTSFLKTVQMILCQLFQFVKNFRDQKNFNVKCLIGRFILITCLSKNILAIFDTIKCIFKILKQVQF